MDRLIKAIASVALLLLGAAPAFAQIQCGTVTTCPQASTPFSGAEILYMVQGGVSKRTTVSQIGAAVAPFVNIGIVQPANTAALNADILTAIAAGQSGIALVPGVYPMSATGTGADGSTVAGLINAPTGDFTFDGQGSTLQLVGADVSSYANILQMQNATTGQITIRNLDLTYASPPFAQATLSSKTACVANANGSATFAMQTGYAPAWASVLRIDQYSAITGLFVINVYSSTSSSMALASLGGGNYSVAFNGATQCNALTSMTIAQTYVLDSTQFGFYGINAYHVHDLVFDNVRILNAAGNGFQIAGAHDVRYINNSGVYKAPGAYRSVNGVGAANVYMSAALITDPTVHFKGSGDDAFFAVPFQINIASVVSQTNVTLSGSPYVLVGNVLQFVDANGVFQGVASVASVTASAGNTIVTLSGSGAPSGVASTWIAYNQSQGAAFAQINGGDFGDSPTRGLFVDAQQIELNAPHVVNTGSGGIFVSYGTQNVGLVPTTVTVNAPVVINNNYANDANDGSVAIEGTAPGSGGAATAGQIATVIVENINCQQAGSSCVYLSAVKNATASFGSFQNWFQLLAAPVLTQGCGTTMYQEAWAFCNVTNAIYTSGYFLTGGGQETSSGSSVVTPVTPASAIVGQVAVANGGTGLATLTAHAPLLGEGTSNVAFAAPGAAGQALLSQGATSDPAFGTIAIAGSQVTSGTVSGSFMSAVNLAAGNVNGGVTGALPNANLANSSLTIGSTNVALGATATTLAGLASVTSTTFVGALTGHASSDCALAGCTMAGNIAMGGFSLTGAATISANQIAMLVGSTNFFTASAASGQLMIQTTTSGAVTTNALLIDATQNSTFYGHVIGSNSVAAAAISSCGTLPSITGGDNFGKIIAGSGVLTSCVINFGKTWGSAPACVVSSPTSIAALTVTTSTTQLTIGATSLTSDVLSYVCGSTAWLEPANDNGIKMPYRRYA